jgi:hypothetical protein
MIYREIVHTCSNAEVARAAVKSIGGDFAREFAADASRRQLPSGVWAARLVREFAEKADEVELQGVVAATHGSASRSSAACATFSSAAFATTLASAAAA